jgi:hypothetical protein
MPVRRIDIPGAVGPPLRRQTFSRENSEDRLLVKHTVGW